MSTASISDIKTSPRFKAEDADVIFQSSDGVQYHIHRKNLQCCAAAFPPAEFESDKDDIIHLPETSRPLDLLFGFMYPEPTPDTSKLSVEDLLELAEAADKYQAFSVITICKLRMHGMINDYPIGVLRYAAVCYDKDLLDDAARVAIAKPLDTVVLGLSPKIAIAWVQYFQKWRDALTRVQDKNYGCTCQTGKALRLQVLDRIGSREHMLRNLNAIFDDLEVQGCCYRKMNDWRREAEYNQKFSHAAVTRTKLIGSRALLGCGEVVRRWSQYR
ncbi:hypothetical protein AX14_006687 [Amanita brunnescens Koide BX004]|nr:hypothetical protein AX14_006687 [Amanita brunnescens Koide BX004]